VQRASGDGLPLDRVSIFDTALELFVLVPASARGRRTDISLALEVAQSLAPALAKEEDGRSSSRRPFVPPVHALVFPTVVPKDLAVLFRDRSVFDDLVRFLLGPPASHLSLLTIRAGEQNGGEKPRLINLWTPEAAKEALGRTAFTADEMSDPTCLPIGVAPS
jgi:hypothetical protein